MHVAPRITLKSMLHLKPKFLGELMSVRLKSSASSVNAAGQTEDERSRSSTGDEVNKGEMHEDAAAQGV
eukprot:765924-Hanusia_phi.AAC.3